MYVVGAHLSYCRSCYQSVLYCLQSEAVRLARQLSADVGMSEVKDILTEMASIVPHTVTKCFHNRPFIIPLVNLEDCRRDCDQNFTSWQKSFLDCTGCIAWVQFEFPIKEIKYADKEVSLLIRQLCQCGYLSACPCPSLRMIQWYNDSDFKVCMILLAEALHNTQQLNLNISSLFDCYSCAGLPITTFHFE